jgi:hypothetical protein
MTKEGDKLKRALALDNKRQAKGIREGIEAASKRAKRTLGMPLHKVRAPRPTRRES